MHISSTVRNTPTTHEARVETDGTLRLLHVPAKESGRGSAVSGGEFLMLALATCFCNDIYREAAKRDIEIRSVEVEANALFEAAGRAATHIEYKAKVEAKASAAEVQDLIRQTDSVAEVHLTVRQGLAVTLVE